MLIIALFSVLFAVKLAAIALVYYAGPAAAIPIILAALAVGIYLEPPISVAPLLRKRAR